MASPLEKKLIVLQNLVGGSFCGRRRDPLNDSQENVSIAIESDNNDETHRVQDPQESASLKADSDTDENNSTSCGEMSCEFVGDSADEASTDNNLPAEGSESGEMPESLPEAPIDAPPGLPPPPGPPPGLTHPAAATGSEADDPKAVAKPTGASEAPRVIQLFAEITKKDMRNIGPPPGLEHPTKAEKGAGKADAQQKMKGLLPGTRLTAQASPFVPVFAPKTKRTTSEFTGAFRELDKSLSKLNGAMAEWDVCLSKVLNAEKQAKQQAPPSSTPLKAPKATAAFVPRWQVPVDCRPLSQLWQQFPEAAAVTANAPKAGTTGTKKAPADVAAIQLVEPKSEPMQDEHSGDNHMEKEQCGAEKNCEKDSLRTNLRDLEQMDSDRVLIVRRINRLGLESPALLEEHFSQYGTVEKVMVSHSRAKSYFGYSSARVRPAGLGFVVMSRIEDAMAILEAGVDQVVNGATITVHAYETRCNGDTKDGEKSQMETA